VCNDSVAVNMTLFLYYSKICNSGPCQTELNMTECAIAAMVLVVTLCLSQDALKKGFVTSGRSTGGVRGACHATLDRSP
jgi:hypothetical protein